MEAAMFCLDPEVRSGLQQSSFAFVNDWNFEEIIDSPFINAAILRRGVPPCPQTLAEICQRSYVPAMQMVFERGSDPDLIAAELDHGLDLRSEDSFAFYTDIVETALSFLKVSRKPMIGIRFETVDGDSCRNFHVDNVHLRLVTTYTGRGTEWLDNRDLVRSALGNGQNEKVIGAGAKIGTAPSGWVLVTKGEKYPGNSGNGFVHRSPHIEGSGQKRILLRMDAMAFD